MPKEKKDPRGYSPQTIKRLFGLSGNLCAFEGCNERLVNSKNALDSNICHIEAAKPKGQRYNPDMTDEKRADYDNLILLCRQHHDETNDVEKYTVDVLKKMKQDHESQYLGEVMTKNPSMLNVLINAIAKIDIDNINEKDVFVVFDPQDKIEYNSVKKYRYVIDDYKIYLNKLENLYIELEEQGSLKKEKILRIIRDFYLKAKAQYAEPLLHSDDIIDDVINSLYEKLDNDLYSEEIESGVNLVIVDAFMRCKILEEPKPI